METTEETRRTVRRTSIVLLFILISAVFVRLIWGFVLAVVLAAIFAGLTYPLYTWLLKFFRGRKPAASAVTLVVVVLLAVGPLTVFVEVVAIEGAKISQSARPQVNELLQNFRKSESSLDWIPFWDRLETHRELIMKKVGEVAEGISSLLVNSLSAAARGTLRFFFELFIMLYSMFFFLMHGREVRDQVMRLFPLQETDKEILLDKFVSVSRATLKGTLVIGIVQGGLAGVALAAVGIKGAVFWGTVMAVLSIVPGIGTALVWVPAVIYLFVVGRTLPAIGLLVWCVIIVGTADNFLRPLLVGKDTEMPDLLVLLTTLGGLALFGTVGLVIGPVIGALFLAILRIYSETFGDVLMTPEVASDEG